MPELRVSFLIFKCVVKYTRVYTNIYISISYKRMIVLYFTRHRLHKHNQLSYGGVAGYVCKSPPHPGKLSIRLKMSHTMLYE